MSWWAAPTATSTGPGSTSPSCGSPRPCAGHGLGARLARRLEREAHARGCRQAHLETLSYQARAFYERLGYTAFAELPDYPPGHTKVYLCKTLAEASMAAGAPGTARSGQYVT